MKILDSVLDAIGNTPMVRLNRLPGDDCAEVVVKLEYFSPSGSVKDRSAWGIIRDAEQKNLLGPDSIIVEASSGNQGIALAMIGAVRGYRVVVFMPESMSVERQTVLKAYGAEIVLTPVGEDMEETFATAKRMAEEFAASIPNAFLSRQFDNEANPLAHSETTAREILEQTGGKLDAFVSGIGTGGTITGTGRELKKAVPIVIVVAVEPITGPCSTPKGVHAQEGITTGFSPAYSIAR